MKAAFFDHFSRFLTRTGTHRIKSGGGLSLENASIA
jgi:hypothetical protein